MIRSLKAEQLRWRCDPALFDFETTEEVAPLVGMIGQERAVQALELGLQIKDAKNRYNICVVGEAGLGKMSAVRHFLDQFSSLGAKPPDLCYVYNRENPAAPRYLKLPAGFGITLKQEVHQLILMLQKSIPEAFGSDDYQARRWRIEQEFERRQNELYAQWQQEAAQRGFQLEVSPAGVKTIPLIDAKPISSQEEYDQLNKKTRKKIETAQAKLIVLLQSALQEAAKLEEEREAALKRLDRDVAAFTVDPRITKLKKKYNAYPKVVEFLSEVESDILENVRDFLDRKAQVMTEEGETGLPPAATESARLSSEEAAARLRRFEVNVLVDHGAARGAPVVVEEYPAYFNLFGKLERQMLQGALTTDFTLIRPGAFHRANGGYLVLNAENLLKQPLAWEKLKIALKYKEIRIEEPPELAGYATTESLQPEPIPLNAKVILVAAADTYQALQVCDEDFTHFFSIKSEFDDQMARRDENIRSFGPFIRARCAEDPELKPFHRTAVARLVEYATELAGDQQKLSVRFSQVMAILGEASFRAAQEGSEHVMPEHVEQAIRARDHRHNLLEEKLREMIARGELLIDTEGEAVGQVNGLEVFDLGDFQFGKPVRITANVYLVREGVIHIEREAELSGKIHTKGILILKGWLGQRFAYDKPLSLSASITFEQSYSQVDGDSASSTELYSLISALSGLPIKQGIAVTGSVSQKGKIQPVGAINDKIEGFFKVCQLQGLTGHQGVIIPRRNVQHLMLNTEVVQAVKRGEFHVYPIDCIEEGLELLMGEPAGDWREGRFEPLGSIYDRVDHCLRSFSQKLKEFGSLERP